MKQSLLFVHHAIVWCVFLVAAIIAASLINSPMASASGEPFVTTWKTNAQYPSGDSLSFKINPAYHGTVSYVVDWGDGVVQSGISGDITHDYPAPGEYTVEITGDFPGFYYKESSNTPALLLSVDQWGDISWKNADHAFSGATSMRINATDNPDLSQATTLEAMFLNAFFLNDSVNDWDVSNIVNFESMFEGAQNFDQPLNNWNTSSAVNMNRMFFNARSFNQNISNWDTSSLMLATSMFETASNFDQNIGSWDMSGVIGVDNMLANSGLQWQQYDATIIGWATQALQQNRVFTSTGLEYCGAVNQREVLITNYGWDISGDSRNSQVCTPTEIRFVATNSADLTIDENIAADSVLGQLEVVDADSNQDSYSFDFQCQVSAQDNQNFTLQNESLLAGTVFDYENPVDTDQDNSYQLCVRVTDQSGNTFEQLMTITVSDVENEQEQEDEDEQTGQVLGAVDEDGSTTSSSSESDTQVLGDSESAVLASTGIGAISAVLAGISIMVVASITGVIMKSKPYRLNK